MSELRYERESKKTIYVSLSVWRALHLIAKAFGTTADQLADETLDVLIQEKYPSVVKYLAEDLKLQKDIIKELHEQR